MSTWSLEGEASSNVQCPGSGTLEMENSVGIKLAGDDKSVKLDLRKVSYLIAFIFVLQMLIQKLKYFTSFTFI